LVSAASGGFFFLFHHQSCFNTRNLNENIF